MALSGLLCASTVHILSFFNVDVMQITPFVYLLHVGVLIVLFSVSINLRNSPEYRAHRQSGFFKSMNPATTYTIIFRQTPAWLSAIVMVGFVYAFLGCILFIFNEDGIAGIKNGHYVLQDGGDIIKTVTEAEYHRHRVIEMRGFSGCWIAFYGFAIAMLYPLVVNNVSQAKNLKS